ncbi:hypothetical protein B8W98_12395, partial [Lentilactobacillus parakefiri]
DLFIIRSLKSCLRNQLTSKQLWILDGNVGGHASANNAVKDYTARIQAFLNQVDAQNSDTKLNITDDQHVAA